MSKITLEELRALRAKKSRELQKRDLAGKTSYVIVGMGTCGIAAGAKETLDAFLNELDAQNVKDVAVTQCGCMGLCAEEPTVKVVVPGMPEATYNKVDANLVKQIVKTHLIGHELVK